MGIRMLLAAPARRMITQARRALAADGYLVDVASALPGRKTYDVYDVVVADAALMPPPGEASIQHLRQVGRAILILRDC